MIILQNSPSIIVMNLYLLSIQKTPFITVTMLSHYKCLENFTPEPNIYRGWTVYTTRWGRLVGQLVEEPDKITWSSSPRHLVGCPAYVAMREWADDDDDAALPSNDLRYGV